MKITIVGSGISGLSCAYRLKEIAARKNTDIKTSILESSGRFGGLISTRRHNSFILEEGPDSVLTKNPSVVELAKKLGIEDGIIPAKKENRLVYIFLNGRLIPLPEGFYTMAPTNIISFLKSPLFTIRGKARILIEPLISTRKVDEDESLYSFVTRRFGHEAFERVVQPLISGIYTADPKRLSLKAVMPQFVNMEEKYGSVIKGLRRYMKEESKNYKKQSGARYSMFVSFRDGMGTLIDALVSSLPEGSIQTGKEVVSVQKNGPGWNVYLSDGTVEQSDGVVMAVPSHISSGILEGIDSVLSGYLGEIEYLSSSLVNLVYDKTHGTNFPKAFGVLLPSIENSNVIAFSFLSQKFENRAHENQEIIRCFLGGDINQEINMLDEEEIIKICVEEVRTVFGVENDPVYQKCKRYYKSLPLYSTGHLERVEKIEERLANIGSLSLAGNAYSGIGIPDCINTGFKAAEKVFSEIEKIT